MREVTRGTLTLWVGQSPEPAPCATCHLPTYSRWEDESGLFELRSCCFASAQAEYERRLSLDHAGGYHDDAPKGYCPLCELATAGLRPMNEGGPDACLATEVKPE